MARLNCSNAQIRDKLDDLFARHKIRDIGGLEMLIKRATEPFVPSDDDIQRMYKKFKSMHYKEES